MLPRPGAAFSWLRGNRDLNARFTAEFFVILGTGQGLVFLLGSIAGLVAAGEFQAGQLLLGPITFVILSSMLFGVPELARRIPFGTHELKRVATIVSTATVLATAAWFVCAMLMPAGIGHKLLGKSWDPARRLLPPLAIYSIASSASTGATCGIHALEAARSSLRLRLMSMPVTLGLAIPLIATHGSLGASWALATAGLIMLPFWWRTFLSTAAGRASGAGPRRRTGSRDRAHARVGTGRARRAAEMTRRLRKRTAGVGGAGRSLSFARGCVLIVGPDGAGKTTVAEQLVEATRKEASRWCTRTGDRESC